MLISQTMWVGVCEWRERERESSTQCNNWMKNIQFVIQKEGKKGYDLLLFVHTHTHKNNAQSKYPMMRPYRTHLSSSFFENS